MFHMKHYKLILSTQYNKKLNIFNANLKTHHKKNPIVSCETLN